MKNRWYPPKRQKAFRNTIKQPTRYRLGDIAWVTRLITDSLIGHLQDVAASWTPEQRTAVREHIHLNFASV
jgi:hypothetical protein